MENFEEFLDTLLVPPGKTIDLATEYDAGFTGKWVKKKEAKEVLSHGIKQLAEMQDKLYAQNNYAVLIILQGLDASGKDSTIKHVMSGVNPQGVNVYSFKAPSSEELDHDYLWRIAKVLPRRGHIGVFNRSYYEEVTIVRVHPEHLVRQNLPPALINEDIWPRRFEEINNFEKYLVNNGILVLKFFLNLSKEEQRMRFLKRTIREDKNWKFEASDLETRQRWDDYIAVYEDMLNHTSTSWAPWYVVPADHKWFARLAIAAILNHTLDGLGLAYPTVSEEQREVIEAARIQLESEGDAPYEPADDEPADDEPADDKPADDKKTD
jgi:PPK2 family polyphosphate:nucleotide phosphotransferase